MYFAIKISPFAVIRIKVNNCVICISIISRHSWIFKTIYILTELLCVGMCTTSYRCSGGQSQVCRWLWGEGDACGSPGPIPLEWSSWRRCCRYAETAGILVPAWTLLWHGGSQRYASWEGGCRDASSTHGALCWEHHGRFERHSLWIKEPRAYSTTSNWIYWISVADRKWCNTCSSSPGGAVDWYHTWVT